MWLERCEQEGLERSTLVQYRSHLRYHIEPLLGAEKLSRLTTPRIEQFRDELLSDGSRPLTKKVLASVKAILKEAQRRGLVAQNVARDVTIRSASRHKKRAEIGADIPTKQEIRDLIENSEGRRRALLITAVFTGMRASELRGLTWDHVDLDAKVIRVRQARRYQRAARLAQEQQQPSRRPDVAACGQRAEGMEAGFPKGELGSVFPGRGWWHRLP